MHLHKPTICVLLAVALSTSAGELDRDVLNNYDVQEVMETTLFNVIDAISYSDDPERYDKACSHVDAATAVALPPPHSVVLGKVAVACTELPGARSDDEAAFWRWGILRPSFLWICAYGDAGVRQRVGGACNVRQRRVHAQAATERYNDKGDSPELDWYSVTVRSGAI